MYNGIYVATCLRCGKVKWTSRIINMCSEIGCGGTVISELPADRDKRLGITKHNLNKIKDPLVVGQ